MGPDDSAKSHQKSSHAMRPELRALDELRWCLFSPNLLTSESGLPVEPTCFVEARSHPVWTASDQLAESVFEMLTSASSYRVGMRFESLIRFGLEHDLAYTLLAHNLQVFEDKRTLGSFDFIVKNAEQQVEHWEVAVKYYLQSAATSEWSDWIGPNRRDRLDLKVSRMRDHQLPLSSHPAGRAALAGLGIERAPVKRALLKGILFYPWATAAVPPLFCEPTAPRGVWVQHSELSQYAQTRPSSRWIVRTRPDWIAPVSGAWAETIGMAALSEVSAQAERPVMVSRLEGQEDDRWRETERLFVVPDDWSESERGG